MLNLTRLINSSIVLGALATLAAMPVAATQCADIFDQTRQRLHSNQQVDLCEITAGKTVLVVNTASHCGFTPQFKGLEALYKRFKDDGLAVIGFPSDDFWQEADDQAETAKVCYINYGVTFTMVAPGAVKGDDADPVFKALAEKSGTSPKWNFYKYLVSKSGEVTDVWSPNTSPDDPGLVSAVESQLQAR